VFNRRRTVTEEEEMKAAEWKAIAEAMEGQEAQRPRWHHSQGEQTLTLKVKNNGKLRVSCDGDMELSEEKALEMGQWLVETYLEEVIP
jgi:hypothetical protein